MKIENLPIISITDCFNKSDIARKLNLPLNGTGLRLVAKYITLHNLSTEHFDKNYKNRKYRIISKICPICSKIFTTKHNDPKSKVTCSHSCSNTYFRSGKANGNWKDDSYRSTCFLYHKKECIICGENKIVSVHHMDENKNNNSPENLIPLCPTHHQYFHSSYRNEVEPKILSYINSYMCNK